MPLTFVLGYCERCLVDPSQFMKVSSQAWQTPTVQVSILRSIAMIRFCRAARPKATGGISQKAHGWILGYVKKTKILLTNFCYMFRLNKYLNYNEDLDLLKLNLLDFWLHLNYFLQLTLSP